MPILTGHPHGDMTSSRRAEARGLLDRLLSPAVDRSTGGASYATNVVIGQVLTRTLEMVDLLCNFGRFSPRTIGFESGVAFETVTLGSNSPSPLSPTRQNYRRALH
jgi:hypothetical protein